ncbi:hypothetical protein N402_01260 [Helicobacter pylori FD423]|nr:hypothetical protein N402_01260 [Helicobacter pylori FD423]
MKSGFVLEFWGVGHFVIYFFKGIGGYFAITPPLTPLKTP